MNRQSIPLKSAVLFALLFAVFSQSSQAAIKCWTNKEGVRECGNSVPPEYAQQGHQEMSKSGMIVEEQKRAKTPEEMEEEERQKMLLADKNRALEAQAKSDKILLATFSTVEEIELVREDRLRVIKASISLAEKQIDTIQQDLDKRIQAAANSERSGKAPNDALLKDIGSLEKQISNKQEYIAGKKQELEQTSGQYAANIDRFKKLKGL